MKQRISIAAILIALALFTACSRVQPTEESSASTPTVDEIQMPEQEVEASEEVATTRPIQTIEPEIVSDQELEEQSNQDIAEETEETEETEPWDWSYDMPENQDMNAATLSALHTTYDSFSLLSAVIVRNGVIVDTYCEEGYDETSVFTLHSTSKSITSALVGIAIEQGYIENVDVPLSDYFPELLSASDTRWQRITLRHLLTHALSYPHDAPVKNQLENYLKNAEMALEDDYGMIDGIINNGPKQPTVAELEAQIQAGMSISLMDLAAATHRERNAGKRKQSVLEQLKKQPVQERSHKTAPGKSAEKEL